MSWLDSLLVRLRVAARSRWKLVAVVVGLVAGAAVVTGGDETSVVAYFPSTKNLYAGSDVRIMGVKVGSIDSVQPTPDGVRVKFHYDAKHAVPADAKAVIISPALVADRYIQLAPGYSGGPKLAGGATIPKERTAVPVEFDQLKEELSKLATALGPKGANKTGSLGRLLDSAAGYAGQGGSFQEAIVEVSKAMQTLSDGRTDLFAAVRNLQVFVSAMSASDAQIVQFTSRLNTVSTFLDNNKKELAKALSDLDVAAADVQRFVKSNRAGLKESTAKLADLARLLSSQRPALEQALHAAPTALVNFYNVYDPLGGSYTGPAALANFQNPAQFVCSAMGAATKSTPAEAGRLCAEKLGPLLQLLQMNYPPIGLNPVTRPGAPHRSGSGDTVLPRVDQLSQTLNDLLVPRGGQ